MTSFTFTRSALGSAAGAITVQATAGPGAARPTSVRRGDEGTEPLDLSGMPRFAPPAVSLAALLGRVLPRVAGRPVHLALAMDAANRLRMKPQNLVAGLPLTAREDAA